jgi:hypothetical protein
VRELAPLKPDFVKIWVDDRNGRAKKLTPEMFTRAPAGPDGAPGVTKFLIF